MKKTLLALSLVLVLVACESSKTDQKSSSGAADIFVPTSDNSGSISIKLDSDAMSVADTTNFLVEVKDANGGPVEGIQVACDTEGDLALLEPTSGLMLTGPYGSASGVVGCEDTGSFMMVCRLPVGGNKRELVRIKCEGERPVGFDGFPNAGGGGLGNGVADQSDDVDDDTDNNFAIRLLSVVYTTEEGASFGIDTSAGQCGTGSEITPEPFSDDKVKFTIKNETDQVVRFTGYTYTVQDHDGSGASYTSPELSLIGEALQSGQTGEFEALFTDVVRISPVSALKRFYGSTSNISSGFKNVTVTISGNKADGTPVTVTGSTALSFEDFDIC